MILKKIRLLITIGVFFLLASSSASAHLFGASLEKEVDNYFIDIGHSEYTLEVGDSVRLDFDLFQKENRTQSVDFTDMWVRIAQGNKSIFAGALAKPQLGKTGMTLVFPEPGEYELYVRYHNQKDALVETTFPLSVEPDPVVVNQKRIRLIMTVSIGIVTSLAAFLAGLLLHSYIPKIKRKKNVKK